MKRQPMVVSKISAERENASAALPITNGARVIDSTPPAIAKSISPARIAPPAAPPPPAPPPGQEGGGGWGGGARPRARRPPPKTPPPPPPIWGFPSPAWLAQP